MQKKAFHVLHIFLLINIFMVFVLVESLPKTYVLTNNSNYLLGNTLNFSDNQIIYPGGENLSALQSDSVSVSKTIDGTDKEDFFNITLQVKTEGPVNEYLDNEAVAVVIVMDLSNTMTAAIDGSSTNYNNSKAYKATAAAKSFVQQFYNGSTDYPNNVIGAVGFNTSGINLVGMTNLNTQDKVNSFNSKLDTGVRNVVQQSNYNTSKERFTNIESGLKMARTMLNDCPQKHKFIIFLSDGLPTTYTKKTGATDYVGVYTDTLTDGLNKGRTLASANYSDKGAKRARQVAMNLKSNGVKIYSIGVGLNTFQGTPSSTLSGVPFGRENVYQHLNGEKFIMNQLARSVIGGVSTIENDFSNITSGNTGSSRWNTYKDRIYDLKWEIRNNYNPATMGTTPIYDFSEKPPATQPPLFENWLQYGIGSGYYYDVTNSDGLTNAINDIYSDLNTNVLSKRTTLWTTSDPMSTYDGDILKEYIEFRGFFNQNGELVQSLTGTAGENGTNTAMLDRTKMQDGIINWDLKNSGYSIIRENNKDIYIYELKYQVRLKTDKQGFIKEVPYDSNGTTTLTYVVEKNGTTSDIKTIDYPIPQVKGFLTDIKIKKTVEGLAPGFTFTNEYSNFEFKVNFVRTNNEPVTNKFTYDKYDANGNVVSQNQIISDGGTFTLSDGEYVIIHNLFHDINWSVSEIDKDGFVSTITSGNPSGTTISTVALSEVEYNNKAYHLKMKKVDDATRDPLEGVKFSLYASYQNGKFSDIVTNMNGVLLQNLLTDEGGMIDFGNLSFPPNGSKTYYLVEEDTIDKYNLLNNYVGITVDNNGITAKYENSDLEISHSGNTFEVIIPNAKGIDFPETGGNGNLLFILIGIMLLVFSSISFFVRKN